MGILGRLGAAASRRPALVAVPLAAALAAGIVNYFNPVAALIINLVTMGENNVFESLMALLQFVLHPSLIAGAGLYIAIGLILLSVIAAFVLSGYLGILHNEVNGRPKTGGEFMQSVKSSYFRILRITVTSALLSALLVLFLLVASVPAIAVTRAASTSGKTVLLASAIFLDAITVWVFFLAAYFYRIYLLFWFPAAFTCRNKPFAAGKRAADRQFWKITGRMLGFDVIFAAVQILFILLGFVLPGTGVVKAIMTLIDAVFLGIFFAAFILYIFDAFRINNAGDIC